MLSSSHENTRTQKMWKETPWPNLMCCPGICMEGLRRTTFKPCFSQLVCGVVNNRSLQHDSSQFPQPYNAQEQRLGARASGTVLWFNVCVCREGRPQLALRATKKKKELLAHSARYSTSLMRIRYGSKHCATKRQ
jgi:hypothetical protein